MDEELADSSDSSDGMNQARFLFDELDEGVIPETPSPCRASGVCPPSRGAGCWSKRRRLAEDSEASPWSWQINLSNPPKFHPASGCTLPSSSSSSSPSSSSSSSSSSGSLLVRGQHEQHILRGLLGSVFEPHCTLPMSGGQLGHTLDGLLDSGAGSPYEALPDSGGPRAGTLEGLPGPGSGLVSATLPAPPQSRKRGRTRRHRAAPPTPDGASLSFLTAEERRWVNGEHPGAAAGTLEVICVSEEEDAVVRSLQLEEDEAMARSLQDQFDREEVRPQQNVDPHRQNPYMEPRWTPATSSMQGVMAALQDDLIGRQRGSGRSRARGRRNRMTPDLFEDLQGNNYEALLQFEEQQGSIANRRLMSRRQINRFPTKTFSPASNAACARCHICFCDYADGEQLRMLSCFHDYHVACIDRWLKDNATCPICRANMTES
ncbi:unnamed protein product [Lota lota]